jgi:hypothetical protein
MVLLDALALPVYDESNSQDENVGSGLASGQLLVVSNAY